MGSLISVFKVVGSNPTVICMRVVGGVWKGFQLKLLSHALENLNLQVGNSE